MFQKSERPGPLAAAGPSGLQVSAQETHPYLKPKTPELFKSARCRRLRSGGICLRTVRLADQHRGRRRRRGRHREACAMTARVTMPKPIEIGIVEKNSREHVVVSLSEFRGHQLIDVRVYASFDGGEERHPTKKGISIKVERLRDLMDVLQGAERKAIELGLLGDGGGE
jgi:hypothetical protein